VPEEEEIEFKKLNKTEILEEYLQACKSADIEPHPNFLSYLAETKDENESIDLVIHGNSKENFNQWVEDVDVMVFVETLEPYAIYVEDIDLRYNHISDTGAETLSWLIGRAVRLLGLNL